MKKYKKKHHAYFTMLFIYYSHREHAFCHILRISYHSILVYIVIVLYYTPHVCNVASVSVEYYSIYEIMIEVIWMRNKRCSLLLASNVCKMTKLMVDAKHAKSICQISYSTISIVLYLLTIRVKCVTSIIILLSS